jgi:hypothetical protein
LGKIWHPNWRLESRQNPQVGKPALRAGGCSFKFDAATIKPLIRLAGSELKKL